MKMATMYLQSVICINASESGKDEVYVKYNIDDGDSVKFPSSGYHSMSSSDYNPWYTNLKLEFQDTVRIRLYDKDDVSGDDSLGSHTYVAADAQFTESKMVSGSGGHYVLVTGPTVQE